MRKAFYHLGISYAGKNETGPAISPSGELQIMPIFFRGERLTQVFSSEMYEVQGEDYAIRHHVTHFMIN